MKYFLLAFFILSVTTGFSQNAKEKLLLDELDAATVDSTRLRLLREITLSFLNRNDSLSMHYAGECLRLSLKAGDKNTTGFSYNSMGSWHFTRNEYVEAMELFFKALRIFTELDNRKQIGIVYTNIGLVNMKQGNLKEARSNLEQSIRLKEEINNTKGLATSYLNLAAVVYLQGDLDEALSCFQKGRKYAQSTNNGLIESACLNGLAAIQTKKKNYVEAIKGFSEAIEVFEKLEGDHRKAITGCYHNLGLTYRRMGDLDKAIEFLNKSLKLAQEIQSNEDIMQAYDALKEYYKDRGDYRNALIAEEYLSVYKDSVFNHKKLKAINELQEKYKTEERKRKILQLRQANGALEDKATLQYSLLTVSIGAFLLIFLVVFFYLKQMRAKQQRKQTELEQKALRAQMNPHFIFNSLNSIQRMYIEGDEDTANDYMADFSRLLRSILENSGKEVIRLKEELDVIRLYMDLEILRTDHSFEYTCELGDAIDPLLIRIPPLIFQPYLENAIWHGIISKSEKGKITLRIQHAAPGKLICEVIDNGVGFYSSKKSKSLTGNESKGMQITAERLGGEHNVSIEELSTGGTRITLTIYYTL